jgi:uncharacterized integral membrane protein
VSGDAISQVVVILGPAAVGALIALLAVWVRDRRRQVREARRRTHPE